MAERSSVNGSDGPVADVGPAVALGSVAAVGPVAVADGVVVDGWVTSSAVAEAPLRLTDCCPEAKLVVQADPAGPFATEIGVEVGRAELFDDGLVVVSVAPGEWIALTSGDGATLAGQLEGLVPGERVTAVDLSHGLALFRLTGDDAAATVSALGGSALRPSAFSDGTATAMALAGARVVVVRDDLVEPGDPDDEEPEEQLVPSYLVLCDRSQGDHVHTSLLAAGERYGIETEGYLAVRDR
jgi:heterotetrameric sarcosine oxidase gamma subunit